MKRIQIHLRIKNSQESIWSVSNSQSSYILNDKKVSFNKLDSVFYYENTLEIYEKTVKNAIDRFKHGENVTIFAYGQTGSGKTHTIIGNKEKGFIKLALEDLFPNDLEISFIELFNEKIYDLFTKNELKMYSVENQTIVSGLHSEKATGIKEALYLIDKCLENRKIGKTNFNINSSRSHAILQIKRNDTVLTFIDLAGSERACYDDKRMKEASFINRSLLALGTLVNNLLNNKPIGFRDSKLTRFLQNTINNKTNLLAFCMINSTKECLGESISTLSFAARLSNLEFKIQQSTVIEPESKSIKTDQYKLNLEKIVKLQKERIEDLESMVLRLLEDVEDKRLSNIYLLEKLMYQMKLEMDD